MANHLRRQIREAAALALNGLATSGSRVFQSRVYPLQDSELPGIVVLSNDEDINADTFGPPRTQQRTLTLEIIAVAKANAALDDTLDAMTKEIETAMAANLSLSGACKWNTLRTITVQMSGSTEKPTGMAKLHYDVLYMTAEGTPDVAL